MTSETVLLVLLKNEIHHPNNPINPNLHHFPNPRHQTLSKRNQTIRGRTMLMFILGYILGLASPVLFVMTLDKWLISRKYKKRGL